MGTIETRGVWLTTTDSNLMKIASYLISPEYLLRAIEYNRDRGISGEVFFFYEGLRENNNALANVLRTCPDTQPVSFPTLSA